MPVSASKPWWQDRFLAGLLPVFLLVHTALALLPDATTRMLVGDRAGDRVKALDELFAQPDLDSMLRVIFKVGSPGDWVLFAPAYRLAGSYGVMVQGIAFYAVALVVLYRLCLLLASPRIARIAAIAWGVLPATIFHPHAFVTEAICNPLLISFAYLTVRLELSDDTDRRDLILAGLTCGLLAFVRHIYLLLPVAALLWMLVFRPHGLGARRNAILFLALAMSFSAAWWAIIAAGSSRYELGSSIGGLESNLFLRAERMAAMGPVPLPQSYLDRSKAAGHDLRLIKPPEFIGFVASNPVLFAKSVASDAFNLVANPGVAMVAGRYFGLFDLGERNYRDLNKWREMREREGPLGVARLLWQTSPTGFIYNLAGGVLWAGFLALAAIGAVRFAADTHLTPAIRVLLFGIAAYAIVLTSATAGYTRWDHRSGIDFILALWFAIGWAWAVAWARQRTASLYSAASDRA